MPSDFQLEEESLIDTLRHQLRVQQHEIDRLNGILLQRDNEVRQMQKLLTSKVEREGDVAVWYLEREA